MLDYEFVLKKFMEYVNTFDTKEAGIAMKISHSIHVADLAGKLAKSMDLDKEKIVFCKILGLLHDIGRFYQYEKTKSFDDYKSQIDHARFGVEYLFHEKHIEDFKIPKAYHILLEKAIFNHNKLEIESGLNDEELFYAKFIRDVDKIDIFRQEAAAYEWKFDQEITPNVKKAFYHHELVNGKDVQNQVDLLIMQLAYVYDIQFEESFRLLENSDNLELYLSVVVVDRNFETEFEKIKSELRTFVEERTSTVC